MEHLKEKGVNVPSKLYTSANTGMDAPQCPQSGSFGPYYGSDFAADGDITSSWMPQASHA